MEILLGNYVTYQGKNYEVEKEDALCSGIIKMGNGSKLNFIYTNYCDQGVAIT